jgi:drug/metabolite transporter (DMT)-like permease
MTTLTRDISPGTRSRTASGLVFALISATSFGLSGPLAKGLMEAGWSSGAAVAVRVGLAALVLAIPAALALRGRWWLLRVNAPLLLAYGAIAVAGTQLMFFNAVAVMPVGVALLIEYTAPVAVVAWLWLRHGERPHRLTVVGGVVAGVGLVLVLDVLTGGPVSLAGIGWSLLAMLGAATYFVLSAREHTGLPPIVLAGAGLGIGAVMLLAAGAVGLVPLHATTAPVSFVGGTVVWWVPVLVLGVVTAALSYTAGIAAGRRLGSRLASFVALTEVLAALAFAWLLLGELPRLVQGLGGVLLLAGVVAVKLGEVSDIEQSED